MLETSQVFGVNNEAITSYLWRKEVDGKLQESIQENKHIIIYGSSKQGKSSAIRKNLQKNEFVQVNCDINSGTTDIYKSLLRKIGVRFNVVSEETTSRELHLGIAAKLKTLIAVFGMGEAELNGDITTQNNKSNTYESIEYNLDLANDLCEILKSVNFSKYIVLENFHYLDSEIQNKLAFDLRTFHDNGYKFIIVGIWKDKNRLIQHNGELADRVNEIPVEPWTEKDFREVIRRGCEDLNILIDQKVVNQIIELSFGSIGIVQELCKLYCLYAGIEKKVPIFRHLTSQEYLEKAIQDKVSQYETRFMRALEDIANSSVTKDGLCMPYYLVCVLVKSSIDELAQGINRAVLTIRLTELHHHTKLAPGHITYLLHHLTVLQCRKNISPPIFDYDREKRVLRVIDPTLLYYLNFSSGEEIMEEIVDPRIGSIS